MALAVMLLPAHGLSCAVSARAAAKPVQSAPSCHGGAQQVGKGVVSSSPSDAGHCADEGGCVCEGTQVSGLQTSLAGWDSAAENLSHFVLVDFWQTPVAVQTPRAQQVAASPPLLSAVPLRVQFSSWLI